ncbi:MAG: hypothetical protein ACK4N5_24390 [Myxococcales bacterium]
MSAQYDEDEKDGGNAKRRYDFDCPDCNANNPYDEGFGAGDEIRCFYCGLEYKVQVTDEGKFKYREV